MMPWEGIPRASDIDMESSVLCKDEVITVGLHVFSLTFDLVTVVPTTIPTMICADLRKISSAQIGELPFQYRVGGRGL